MYGGDNNTNAVPAACGAVLPPGALLIGAVQMK